MKITVMQQNDFSDAFPGTLLAGLDGRLTFVPKSLPPVTQFSMELLKRAAEVANELGRLDGYASGMPDRQILIRSFVRREAQLSSFIENTYARYEQIADAQKDRQKASINEQVRETVNAERAITAGVEAVFDSGQPITLTLIRQMHGLLLSDVRGHDSRGRFRTVQVYIGNHHQGVDFAKFVPPPPHELARLMDEFIQYLCGDNELPSLVQIALLHYQFETIHPFEDGNGRLGRILILLGLCQHKLLTTPLLNASLYLERNRQTYYDGLLGVSTRGDWQNWVTFFIEAIHASVVESTAKLRELTELRRRYHDQIVQSRGSALLLKLVDNLFITPEITAMDAAEIVGISYEAARLNVQKLVEAGILRLNKPGKPATYVADTILKAVNAEPTRR